MGFRKLTWRALVGLFLVACLALVLARMSSTVEGNETLQLFIERPNMAEAENEKTDEVVAVRLERNVSKPPPAQSGKFGLYQKLNSLLGGDWLEGSEEEIKTEFNRVGYSEEYQTLLCLRKASRVAGDIMRSFAKHKCKCTELGFCKKVGHQTCNPSVLSYGSLARRLVPKGRLSAAVSTSAHSLAARAKDGSSRAAFRSLFRTLRGRHLCLVGDSVTLQIAESLEKAAERDRRGFRKVTSRAINRECVRPWKACMQHVVEWKICQRSGKVCATVSWFRHYTFEPYDFEELWTHKCDVLLYNLAR
jgi:hypothetical protein